MNRLNFVLSALLIFLVIFALSTGVTAANNTTPIQKDTPKTPDPWNTRTGTSYTTIQAAIDDAQPGDTIIAETGTYTENIQINKTITLKANGTATIKAQNPEQPTIKITANSTTITGFTITNGKHGIYLEEVKNCKITKNKINGNKGFGIFLYGLNNTISENKINNNIWAGICLSCSDNNTISSNNITNNRDGIALEFSTSNRIFWNKIENNGYGIFLGTSIYSVLKGNIIRNCTFGLDIGAGDDWVGNYIQYIDTSNTIDGKPVYYLLGRANKLYDGIAMGFLALVNCKNITVRNVALSKNGFGVLIANTTNSKIQNCNIKNNEEGIYLLYSPGNTISGTMISNSNYYGILIQSSSSNTISKNKIANNKEYGIHITSNSNKNTISWNNITNNKRGIYISHSSYNKVYRNNFIGNGVQAKVEYESTGNLFNLAKPTGGNFWSDYTGKDSNGDGFGDTPYIFTGGKDNLPLIQPLKILTIDPGNGARSIPLTKTIVVTFNWNIQPGPDYNKITVKMPDGTPKTITKWISGNKLYIKATYGWNPGMKFTVTIPKNAIKNKLGKMLATDFKSIFTAAIKVNSIDPANGAVNVPLAKTIVVTFSNNILAGPDYNKITVKTSGIAWIITKWISGNKLYIKATYGWSSGGKFIVTIPKNAVKNSLGSMLATDFKSTFTTVPPSGQ